MKKILYIGLGIVAFFLLLGLFGHWLDSRSRYVIQDGKVYYSGDQLFELTGADPDTFREIPKTTYAKDKNKVYHASFVVEGAEPESFVVLPHKDFAKDKNHVFYWSKKVAGPDGSTFQILSDPWERPSMFGKDRNHVFLISLHGGQMDVIDGADPATFRVLLSWSLYPGYSTGAQYLEYGKDSSGVYRKGNLYLEVDTTTFEILKAPDGRPSVFARDRHRIYNLISFRPLKADPKSFEVFGEEKAKDKDRDYSSLTE